jgi:hypothetical protein
MRRLHFPPTLANMSQGARFPGGSVTVYGFGVGFEGFEQALGVTKTAERSTVWRADVSATNWL